MANLTRTNWPAGWRPDFDAVNGDPSGLLRMDNLRIDKTGAIGLIDSQQQLSSSFSDFVENLFSRIINGQEYFWISTGVSGGSVVRVNQSFGGATSMAVAGAGSPNDKGYFGDALGYVIAVAGSMRTKDPVTTAPIPLGLLTPSLTTRTGGPSGVINSQQKLTIPMPLGAIEGSSSGKNITLDGVSLEGALVTQTAFKLDTTNVGGGGPASDPSNDIIQFPFTVQDQPADVVNTIEVDFLLDKDPATITTADPSTYKDYYSFVWHAGWIQSGFNTKTILSVTRGEFSRYGNDTTLDWTKVVGVRILVKGYAGCTCVFDDFTVIGGPQGGLNGVYNYIQINVANTGRYVAKSPVSALGINVTNTTTNPPTDFTVVNGSVNLTPIRNDPNANEYWFFRKSNADLGIDPNTGQSLNSSNLGQYFFVGKSTDGSVFKDVLSDIEVLQLNADGSLLPNLFLQTLNTNDAINGLQDPIYGIEGLYNERMLYMGLSSIFLSDSLNPDAVDARFTLKPSGDPGEKNLWLKKLTNNVLVLATTKTTYEITGTLTEFPDGTLDVRIINLGEAYPPLSIDVCNYNGGLYYIASDGLRVTTGSNSINVSPQLRHLFQSSTSRPGVATRHGVPGVAIYDGVAVNYSIAAAHSKIYFVLPMLDATRRLFVYDTVTKTYSLMFTDPQKVFSTQADELIAGYGSGAGNTVYLLDYQAGGGVNGEAALPFVFRTVFDANGQPRNRKDTFTLKLILDTGGASVGVQIQKDGTGVTETDEPVWTSLGQISANGMSTIYIPLNSVSLGFRYSIQINDVAGVKTFKLYELTIEYEPRPEQLDYLRILPTNLGTISRKRWTAYAFVIDTLGNSITFTPYLDNVAWALSATVSTGTKLTFIFYFTSEAVATDIGGILSGGVFEFYGVDLQECVSEKLPPPVKYLLIPPDNYGTPNRKRHTSYKFQLLTRGKNVQLTPTLDGTSYDTATFNTAVKTTVEYYFTQARGDVVGIDIGGILQSLEDTPFEYYGNVKPQTVEVLPDRLEYLRIPNSNFGIASRKRIRTLPLVLDTRGADVSFTPIVDGIAGTPQTLNTNGKTTTYYYFNTDSFGTDYGGTLSTASGQPFEFYEMLRPEDVEVLPVPKLFDQLGPMRFDKIGKLFGFRLRLIPTGNTSSLPWAIYDDFSPTITTNSNALVSGSLPVNALYDDIYEVQLAKSINLTVGRLVLGPTSDPFHRYDAYVKVQSSGMESQSRWLPIR